MRRRILTIGLLALVATPLIIASLWLGRELLRPIPPTITPHPTILVVPTPLGGGTGLIAFESRRDGNQEIYTMKGDGSEQTNRTNDPARDYSPVWSPDGQRIAFLSNRTGGNQFADIFVMNADGSEVVQLTQNADAGEWSKLEWSSDGQRLFASRLIFTSQSTGYSQAHLVRADGSGSTLLNLPIATSGDMSLLLERSADETHFAYLFIDGRTSELRILDANGTSEQHFDVGASRGQVYAWAPQDERLAYIYLGQPGVEAEVRLIPLDRFEPVTILNIPVIFTVHALTWSPDGSRLALSFDQPDTLTAQIYLMWMDGSGFTQVTSLPTDQRQLNWSSDGTWLTFVSTPLNQPQGYGNIYILNVENAFRDHRIIQSVPLTDSNQDSNPQWQP